MEQSSLLSHHKHVINDITNKQEIITPAPVLVHSYNKAVT